MKCPPAKLCGGLDAGLDSAKPKVMSDLPTEEHATIHAGDIVQHPLGYKCLVLTEPEGKALSAKVMILNLPRTEHRVEKKLTRMWNLFGFFVVVEGS